VSSVVCSRCKVECKVYFFDLDLKPLCEKCNGKDDFMNEIVVVQESRLDVCFNDLKQSTLNNFMKK